MSEARQRRNAELVLHGTSDESALGRAARYAANDVLTALDRVDALEAENKRLLAWSRAYAKGREGLVKQADLDYAEAERLRGRVDALDAEREKLRAALRNIRDYGDDYERWARDALLPEEPEP